MPLIYRCHNRHHARIPRQFARMRGFSLIEVLIALAIFTVVATTLSSVLSNRATRYEHNTKKTVAQWILANQLVEASLYGIDNKTADIENFALADWQVEWKLGATNSPLSLFLTLDLAEQSNDEHGLTASVTTLVSK